MADRSTTTAAPKKKTTTTPAVEVVIRSEWCKNCGICVEFCPQHVFEPGLYKPTVANPENCNACGMCVVRCPDYALSGHKFNDDEKEDD
jgi:2-oxoglutarate ferredoxin oxidoreductase subunit delta